MSHEYIEFTTPVKIRCDKDGVHCGGKCRFRYDMIGGGFYCLRFPEKSFHELNVPLTLDEGGSSATGITPLRCQECLDAEKADKEVK